MGRDPRRRLPPPLEAQNETWSRPRAGRTPNSQIEIQRARLRGRQPEREAIHPWPDSTRIRHKSHAAKTQLPAQVIELERIPRPLGDHIAGRLREDRPQGQTCPPKRSYISATLSSRLRAGRRASESPHFPSREPASRYDLLARKTTTICRPQRRDLPRVRRTPSAFCRAWRSTLFPLRIALPCRCRCSVAERSHAAFLRNGMSFQISSGEMRFPRGYRRLKETENRLRQSALDSVSWTESSIGSGLLQRQVGRRSCGRPVVTRDVGVAGIETSRAGTAPRYGISVDGVMKCRGR